MEIPQDVITTISSKEFWGVVASGVAAIAGTGYKLYKEITKKIASQVTKTAAVIAGAVHNDMENASDSLHFLRMDQIAVAEDRLLEYATAITVTAPEMARGLVCDTGCGNVEEVAEMWGFSVMMAITGTGVAVMERVINRNGFIQMAQEEFGDLIDNLAGIPRVDGRKRDKDYDLFKAFSKSMYSYFHKEKIKIRIAHIESTLDRMFLRQTVSNIMYECLNLSKEYHDSKSQRATELSERIKRDIIAGKAEL